MNPWLNKNDLSQAYGKWKKVWFDRGLHSPYHSDMQLTVALERQRLYNETLPDGFARFKRLSVPIAFRLLRECENIFGVSKRPGSDGVHATDDYMTFDFVPNNGLFDPSAEAEFCLLLNEEIKSAIGNLHKPIVYHSLTYFSSSVLSDHPAPQILLNFEFFQK